MNQEQEQEYRHYIEDLDLLAKLLSGLKDQMKSESGKFIAAGLTDQIIPVIKQNKADCLIELGEI